MTSKWIFFVSLVSIVLAGCTGRGTIESGAASQPKGAIQNVSTDYQAPALSGDLEARSYSGDDPYDPAVASEPVKVVGASGGILPATGDQGHLLMAGTYSGDDAYDPAAGGLGR